MYSWEKQCRSCGKVKLYVYFAKAQYYWLPVLTPDQFSDQCLACVDSKHHRSFYEAKAAGYFRRTQLWLDCLGYWGHRCAICGRSHSKDIRLAVDHWRPYADGYSLDMLNILPLCQGQNGCNNSKRNRDIESWMPYWLGTDAATQKRAQIEGYFGWILRQEISGGLLR